MERRMRLKEIVSILMESELYFGFSLKERLALIQILEGKVRFC